MPAHPQTDAEPAQAPPPRTPSLLLPLLSFGTGAADGFAYLALGGIFTANMTGNAVLAVVFVKPGYSVVLAGAVTAILAFVAALAVGFRATRGQRPGAARHALILSALCHGGVVLLWWCAPHRAVAIVLLIAASAAAMGLQTVAAKRDGVRHGPTTTYATGTLTDLVSDIIDGTAQWRSTRWLTLIALPGGAAAVVALAQVWPDAAPVVPLLATTVSVALLSRGGRPGAAGATAER